MKNNLDDKKSIGERLMLFRKEILKTQKDLSEEAEKYLASLHGTVPGREELQYSELKRGKAEAFLGPIWAQIARTFTDLKLRLRKSWDDITKLDNEVDAFLEAE